MGEVVKVLLSRAAVQRGLDRLEKVIQEQPQEGGQMLTPVPWIIPCSSTGSG